MAKQQAQQTGDRCSCGSTQWEVWQGASATNPRNGWRYCKRCGAWEKHVVERSEPRAA